MKRLAFNGGEISPAMALRSDMDVYTRSCTILENWDVSPTGGISRRRGMRTIAPAIESDSILIPYTYSETETYLIELSTSTLIIRRSSSPSDIICTFESDGTWAYNDLKHITWQQINSLLLICSSTCRLMNLHVDTYGGWTFEPFEFKCPPWQTTDLRDYSITLTPTDTESTYTFACEPSATQEESTPETGDILRISYHTPRQEASSPSATLRGGNWTQFDDGSAKLLTTHTFSEGDKIAVAGTIQHECYICIKDWDGSSDFTGGCTSPANYQENFLKAEDLSGFDTADTIYALSAGVSYKKGNKLRVKSGFWQLYQCIRAWDGSSDMVPGLSDPSSYPDHFITGIPVGNPLPCKGTWKFQCSGIWYGTYDIRRNYDTADLTGTWETLGESHSPIAAAENNLLTGDESQEESYLQLFLTSIRYKGSNLESGWPPDSCNNRLIVPAYKHDMKLRVTADGHLTDETTIPIQLNTPLTTDDWSWSAFNTRYGHPALATLHESRLVLASTTQQPQTIWMSRTDDLNNFDDSTGDDSALQLTMQTTTQATICWITSHANNLLLGTEDAEWVISAGSSGSLTAENARLTHHGSIGSAHIPAVKAMDRTLYCERGSGRVYQYGYSYESDSYLSTDMTIFADHIAMNHGGITSGTVLRKPYCVAAFVLADGTLALMSYNTMHNVNAWHRYSTQGEIQSIAALSDGVNRDKLYLIVKRGNQRMLEVIDSDSDYTDAGNLDYTSTIETTAFSTPDTDEKRQPQAPLRAYISTPINPEHISIKTGQKNYAPINHSNTLQQGWADLIALSSWTDRPSIGLKVTGNGPCEILALQA